MTTLKKFGMRLPAELCWMHQSQRTLTAQSTHNGFVAGRPYLQHGRRTSIARHYRLCERTLGWVLGMLPHSREQICSMQAQQSCNTRSLSLHSGDPIGAPPLTKIVRNARWSRIMSRCARCLSEIGALLCKNSGSRYVRIFSSIARTLS
jgi:hypothetical protein